MVTQVNSAGPPAPDRRVKLLYVVRERYPTFRVDLTDLFSRHLIPLGFDIDWVAQADAGQEATVVSKGHHERFVVCGASSRQGPLARAQHLLSGVALDIRLAQLISRGDYDLVQVRDKFFGALIALAAARLRRVPFCYWMSYPYPEADIIKVKENRASLPLGRRLFYSVRGLVTKWLLYQVILRYADHVFVQSDRMKEDVAREGVAVKKLTPVPMGVSTERATSLHGACDDPRLRGRYPIVYVGTLVRMRRMDFLINVFEKVFAHEPRALLVLVGNADDADMQFLRDRASQLGLSEHVIFTGFLPMEQAWAYVKAAAVCVSPFRPSPVLDSASPTKVVEYLAYGMPVVANDQPDQKLVIEESGAGICVPYDQTQFAEAILYLLRNPETARAMAAKGPAYVHTHRSYEALARSLDSKYREILANRNRRRAAESPSR